MNICRLVIRASLFSFNTTYHDFLRCIVNIYGFQIGATGSYHSPHFTITPSPPHSRPSRHSLPHPSITPSHLIAPSLATEISLSPITFSSPPSWSLLAVHILRSLRKEAIHHPKESYYWQMHWKENWVDHNLSSSVHHQLASEYIQSLLSLRRICRNL